MSSLSIILLLAALLLLQIPIVAGSVWGAARILRVPISAARSLKTAAILFAISLIVGAALGIASALVNQSEDGKRMGDVLLFVAFLVVSYICVRKALQTSFWKSLAATVLTFLISTAVSVALASVVRMVVEAYVMPTGSMATTLLGLHSDVVCSNCEYQLPISMSDRVDNQGRPRQSGEKHARCPNCGQEFDIGPDAPLQKGDHVFVDKIARPRRFDMIAYHSPEPPNDAYLHRLTGLPGETIAIADGDLFIDGFRLTKAADEFPELWFAVHDTKFVPKSIVAGTVQWEPEGTQGWIQEGSQWRFSGRELSEQRLRFEGKVVDSLAYNVLGDRFVTRSEENPTGDVRIACTIERFQGTGYWGIEWQYRESTLRVVFLQTGDFRLSFAEPSHAEQEAIGKLKPNSKPNRDVSLAIRDGWAYLLEDDHACAKLQIASERLAEMRYHPQTQGVATIFAAECELEVARITVARDVYYTQPFAPGRQAHSSQFSIVLQDDEWFALGDNSQHAKDSRYTGPFKSDAILGVTRFCYWPPERWRSFSSLP